MFALSLLHFFLIACSSTSPSMYLKEGRWWVSLVLSLLSAAAGATPAVGDTSSPPSFSQNSNLGAVLPSYVPWPPVATPAAGEHGLPHNVFLSPRTPVSHDVTSSSSADAVSANLAGFSFLDDQLIARPGTALDTGVSSRSKYSSGDAVSGIRSAENDATTRSRLQASSSPLGDSDLLLIGRSDMLPSSDSYNNDNIFGVVDNTSLFDNDVGVVGMFAGENVSTPGTSADIFRFPSPVFGGGHRVQKTPPDTPPGGPFWEFSAWKRVNARPNEVILLTDVDDTLWSSGGWRVADCTIGGVDKEYARGDGYPGITALYFVLASGRHVTAAADPPAQPTNFLLPFCPRPGVYSTLLELCPAETSPARPLAPSSFHSSDLRAAAANTSTVGAAAAAEDANAALTKEFLLSAASPESATSQHFPDATAVSFSSVSPVLEKSLLRSPSSPAAFCAAVSFAPATGLRRPDPAQCRQPLTLPPAVGLLTARLSTSVFKGWTRSPTFYYDIDWQLEHGARMIYGPNIFAGAWTHGFENNVELMRDAIGGQHSRGRAKVQGFRSALRAGLRPAAQVSASFAAARLRMASEKGTSSPAGEGRERVLTTSASSNSLWSGSGPHNRQRRGIGSSQISALKGQKAGRHSVAGAPYIHTAQHSPAAGGVGRPDAQNSASDVRPRGAVEKKPFAGGLLGSSARNDGGTDEEEISPSRKSPDAVPIAEFAQAIHFSKASVSNRAVPVMFGDTGEKDLEVAASVAALASDRLAAVFSHFVFADREIEKLKASLRAETAVPRGSVPFTFNFNGRRLQAFQFTFDIVLRVGHGMGPPPHSFADLTDAQAYAVGLRIAAYLRDFITKYSRVYLVKLSNLSGVLHGTEGATAAEDVRWGSEQSVRAHPLLFLHFSRLLVEDTVQRQPQTARSGFSGLISRVHRHLKRKVSELTTYMSDEETPNVIEVIPLAPSKPERPEQQNYGVPIVPYRTTISAATGALLLQMITLQDLVNVIIAAVRDLRSLGRPSSCSNVEPLEDHLFDLLAVTDIVGDRIRKDAVQYYDTYADAVAAMRTFYKASRFCARLSPVVFKGKSPSPQEDPANRRYAGSEASVETHGVAFPWGELQYSPAFEECFTAFALMTQPSAAENSSESDTEAQRQRSVPRAALRFQLPVDTAADYLARQAPGVLSLARIACGYLPQLQHWRSAGGAELEFLSAEWFTALTQAVTLSKKPPVTPSQQNAVVYSSRTGTGKGLPKGGSAQIIRWKGGPPGLRRLSAVPNIDPLYGGPERRDEGGYVSERDDDFAVSSSHDLGDPPSGKIKSTLPVGSEIAVANLESTATTTDTRRWNLPSTTLQRNAQQREHESGNLEDAQRLAKRDRPVGDTVDARSAVFNGRVTSSVTPSATPSNAAAFQKLTERTSPTKTSGVNLAVGSVANALFHEYVPQIDGEGGVAASQRGSRTRSTTNLDPSVGARRQDSSRPVNFGTEGSGSAFNTRPTLWSGESASASSVRDSSLLDSNIACPTLSIHHLLRVMRPICSAQRRRLGENAPCAVLSRILYEEKMLSTFNAIQIWIKAGSVDPLYLANVGVTLDPSRPKGGRMHLSRLASTVVEKSEGRERYRVHEARARHKETVTMLPFFLDPACNPFN